MASTTIMTHDCELSKAIHMAPRVDSVTLFNARSRLYLVLKIKINTTDISIFTEEFNKMDAISEVIKLEHFSDERGV